MSERDADVYHNGNLDMLREHGFIEMANRDRAVELLRRYSRSIKDLRLADGLGEHGICQILFTPKGFDQVKHAILKNFNEVAQVMDRLVPEARKLMAGADVGRGVADLEDTEWNGDFSRVFEAARASLKETSRGNGPPDLARFIEVSYKMEVLVRHVLDRGLISLRRAADVMDCDLEDLTKSL